MSTIDGVTGFNGTPSIVLHPLPVFVAAMDDIISSDSSLLSPLYHQDAISSSDTAKGLEMGTRDDGDKPVILYSTLYAYFQTKPRIAWYIEASGLSIIDIKRSSSSQNNYTTLNQSVQGDDLLSQNIDIINSSKGDFRWSLVSYYIIHTFFIIGAIWLFVLMILCAVIHCLGGGIDDVFMLVQSVAIYASIYIIRHVLHQPREINSSNIDIYDNVIEKSLSIGLLLTQIYVVVVIIVSVFMAIYLYVYLSSVVLNIFILILYDTIVYIPLTILFGAIFSYVLFEIRMVFAFSLTIFEAILSQSLTFRQYIHQRHLQENKYRDYVINITIFQCIVNIFDNLYLAWISSGDILFVEVIIPSIFLAYSRQYIILFMILYEILQVNAMGEKIRKQLASSLWKNQRQSRDINPIPQSSRPLSHDSIESNTMLLDTYDVNTNMERLSIYTAVKESPIGCSVFYFRPTKTQVILQMLSLVAVAITIALRLIIFDYLL